MPRSTIAPKPADAVTETPLSAPRAEILPCAVETVEALPDSTINETTAPLAVDTDAAKAEITSGGLPTVVRAPEPWLTVTLVPDMASLWLIAPLA
jgi:hypothetical protein